MGRVCPSLLFFGPAQNVAHRTDTNTTLTQRPGASDDITITECADGSFCFATKNFACCDAGEGVYIVDGEQRSHGFNASSSASPSASAAAAATTISAPSSSLSTGAKAEIGVGVAFGGLFVVGPLVWGLMRRGGWGVRGNNSRCGRVKEGGAVQASVFVDATRRGVDTEIEDKGESIKGAGSLAKVSQAHEVAADRRVEMPSMVDDVGVESRERERVAVAELGDGDGNGVTK